MEYSKEDLISLLSNFAGSGGLDMVGTLIEEEKINACAMGADGFTALHEAAKSGHIDIVRYLLSKEAVIDSKSISCHPGSSVMTTLFRL